MRRLRLVAVVIALLLVAGSVSYSCGRTYTFVDEANAPVDPIFVAYYHSGSRPNPVHPVSYRATTLRVIRSDAPGQLVIPGKLHVHLPFPIETHPSVDVELVYAPRLHNAWRRLHVDAFPMPMLFGLDQNRRKATVVDASTKPDAWHGTLGMLSSVISRLVAPTVDRQLVSTDSTTVALTRELIGHFRSELAAFLTTFGDDTPPEAGDAGLGALVGTRGAEALGGIGRRRSRARADVGRAAQATLRRRAAVLHHPGSGSAVGYLPMRAIAASLAIATLMFGFAPAVESQSGRRLNPMIALHEKGLPVFGITHPAIVAGGRGRGAALAPRRGYRAPGDAAAAALADGRGPRNHGLQVQRLRLQQLLDGECRSLHGLHGGACSPPAARCRRTRSFRRSRSSTPIRDAAAARIVEQLNAGHAGIILQEVESADEVRTALAAMRFKSKGGTRPDEGIGLAAAYWGLSEAQYREKADPWPLNKNGELVLWAIVESKKGIANVREIAAVPGLTVLTVGAGTLGGVFSSTGADGQRVRDQAGFDAGVASVLSACKEFKVACSYPANNPGGDREADGARLQRVHDAGTQRGRLRRHRRRPPAVEAAGTDDELSVTAVALVGNPALVGRVKQSRRTGLSSCRCRRGSERLR